LKKYFTTKIVLLLAFLFNFSLSAESIQIGATTSTDSILLGGQFIYRIEAKMISETNWPVLTDTIGSFEIIEIKSYEVLNSNPIHIRQDFVLTHFDTGLFTLPPTLFVYGNDSLYTKDIDIEVLSIPLQKENSLFGAKSPINIPFGWDDWKYFLLYGYGFFAFLGLIILIVEKLKNKNVTTRIVKEIIPAHIIALGELESLKTKELWQNKQIKTYYSELSVILRTYIENRYHILAMESTTDEINRDLKGILESNDNELLNEFLSTADLVKFAKVKPEESSNNYFMEVVKRFVLKTKLEEIQKED